MVWRACSTFQPFQPRLLLCVADVHAPRQQAAAPKSQLRLRQWRTFTFCKGATSNPTHHTHHLRVALLCKHTAARLLTAERTPLHNKHGLAHRSQPLASSYPYSRLFLPLLLPLVPQNHGCRSPRLALTPSASASASPSPSPSPSPIPTLCP